MKNYIIIIIVSFIFNTNNLNSQEPEEKNKVEMVMKDGRLYDADNLNEIYPKEIKAEFNWEQIKPVDLPGTNK